MILPPVAESLRSTVTAHSSSLSDRQSLEEKFSAVGKAVVKALTNRTRQCDPQKWCSTLERLQLQHLPQKHGGCGILIWQQLPSNEGMNE